jgi:hypothetical protein
MARGGWGVSCCLFRRFDALTSRVPPADGDFEPLRLCLCFTLHWSGHVLTCRKSTPFGLH